MKARTACLPCIMYQSLEVARAASEDEWSQRKVLSAVMRRLLDTDWSRTPAEILSECFDEARGTLKVADPFAARRAAAHREMEELAGRYRVQVQQADDPFAAAVLGAAAANMVDALIFSPVVAPRTFEDLLAGGFALGEVASLREAVDEASSIVYLLDNAGEVYFDAILIEQLRALGKHVRAVARTPGLLHDCTLIEAAAAGLGRVVEVEVEVPVDPDAVPPQLEQTPDPDQLPDLLENPEGIMGTLPGPGPAKVIEKVLAAADLVIAKGSANYETVAAQGLKNVVYLLWTKCEPVAQSLGVNKGSLVLLRS